MNFTKKVETAKHLKPVLWVEMDNQFNHITENSCLYNEYINIATPYDIKVDGRQIFILAKVNTIKITNFIKDNSMQPIDIDIYKNHSLQDDFETFYNANQDMQNIQIDLYTNIKFLQQFQKETTNQDTLSKIKEGLDLLYQIAQDYDMKELLNDRAD